MMGRVPVKVAGPGWPAIPASEPLRWLLGHSAPHTRLDGAVPSHSLARPAVVPPAVNQVVAVIDVETPQLEWTPLPANDPGGVLLPVNDVGQRVLHCPGIFALGTGDEPVPVGRIPSRHQPVDFLQLAPRPPSLAAPGLTQRLRRAVSVPRGSWQAIVS